MNFADNFHTVCTVCMQVVNVTGLSVVVGLMSAADTLYPQVLSLMHIYTAGLNILILKILISDSNLHNNNN